MNEQPSELETPRKNADPVLTLPKEEFDRTVQQLESAAILTDRIRKGFEMNNPQETSSLWSALRIVSIVLAKLNQSTLAQQAARAGSRHALDLLIEEKKQKGGLSYVADPGHTLGKTVLTEGTVGLRDGCHMKLAEFMGRMWERFGQFQSAVHAYETSYPKYANSEKVQLWLSDPSNDSLFQAEEGTDEEKFKITNRDFDALVRELASDSIMKIDALAELERLLPEARKAFEKVKVESA